MSLIKFDQDATIVEKAAYYFAVGFCTLWILFMYASIWGIFQNFLTETANKATAGQHTLGFIFLGAFVVSGAGVYFDKLPFKTSNMGRVALVGVSLLLSLAFYFGFWGIV
jgi:hypothetical protein